jgi:trans-aconitate methyltransferase
MPKKKTQETQEEQSQRFRAEIERMVKDGELNPTEADNRILQIIPRLVITTAKGEP